jgi:hypothetical protein
VPGTYATPASNAASVPGSKAATAVAAGRSDVVLVKSGPGLPWTAAEAGAGWSAGRDPEAWEPVHPNPNR